ncbi:DNA topoisomerase [Oribacterium sp. WCC10]|uniref:DNA topoisomerase n=1 Tax=Oribacterium sp. WCC10 TaxID=1855343 RepID=UPI0008E5A5F0|nr:DNA topoisomerase [Oribacterium sp. WCC10]SFG07222.1 DNA topoisomerase-3 [Oribacterium sp. WCC10]
MKKLFIAEKPSVAQQFSQALGMKSVRRGDGFLEDENYVITWCVGHLVQLSYPEAYDESLKKWSFDTLPFIPADSEWRYEVGKSTKKQFEVVSKQLNREDVDTIYVCTDSAREGEYIYRLVEMMAKVPESKEKKRVWIDSQTNEEILRGIREAKPDSAYDNLSAAAFSRAKEDYLMGINFSRALSLKYSNRIRRELNMDRKDKMVVAVGRVMTCVLGMIVKREQEIRAFQKTTFYRILGDFDIGEGARVTADWKETEGSKKYAPTEIYDGKGFLKQGRAVEFMKSFMPFPREAVVTGIEKKKETKNPPLLYNLAELQNDCSKMFKISPDETLAIAQELYEKKLTTYPRTDARVLSTAVSKEIGKNIKGLSDYEPVSECAREILESGSYRNIGKTRYVDDKKIADHYAIIPTGQGQREYQSLKPLSKKVYELICRRFLAIFYPPAVYQRIALSINCNDENFTAGTRAMKEEGYLKVANVKKDTVKAADGNAGGVSGDGQPDGEADTEDAGDKDGRLSEALLKLKKGQKINLLTLQVKEGETSPPKRYTSGSMILAMENAGNLIEDEDLRAQIKGAGIGTSATRAGILTKLVDDKYVSLQKKTQVLTPTELGEHIAYYVKISIPHLLNPKLTASWEMGLSSVAEGKISEREYMDKLEQFVREKTEKIRSM